MNKALIIGLIFAFVWGGPDALQAKRSKTVSFYYSADGIIYEGSFDIDFKLYINDKYNLFPDYIDYSEDYYNALKMELVLSNLQWDRSDHGKRFKLAFGEEVNMPQEGISKSTNTNVYLYNGASKKLTYNFAQLHESKTTGIVLGLVVLERDKMYPDVMGPEGREEDIFGVGFFVEGLLIVAGEDTEKSELEHMLLANVFESEVESVNNDCEQLSYLLALYVKEQNYERFKESFRSSRYESSNFLEENVKRERIIDYDYEAYSEATRKNTVSSYREYLREYPNGRYASTARSRIVDLTPFEIDQQSEIAYPFKVYTINFVKGVGSRQPIALASNNDDWAIKTEWASKKQLIVKVPEGRQTEVKVSLGRKEKILSLAYEEQQGNPSLPPIDEGETNEELPEEKATTDRNNSDQQNEEEVAVDNQDVPPEKKMGKGIRKGFLAILVTIPFLSGIIYLLYRKAQL